MLFTMKSCHIMNIMSHEKIIGYFGITLCAVVVHSNGKNFICLQNQFMENVKLPTN